MTLNNSIQTTAIGVRTEIEDGEESGTMDVFFRSRRVPAKNAAVKKLSSMISGLAGDH